VNVSPVASVPVTVPMVDVPKVLPVPVDEPVLDEEPVPVDEPVPEEEPVPENDPVPVDDPLAEVLPEDPAEAPPLRTAAFLQPLFVASAC
jgi:hypothetical protein